MRPPIKGVLPPQCMTCPVLCFLDLCAWQHSTGEIEMSDLAFNGGEGGAVHLKQCPLHRHCFVNTACVSNVAASLKVPHTDGYPVRRTCLGGCLLAFLILPNIRQ